MQHEGVHVTYPAWVEQAVDWEQQHTTDTDKMGVAIQVSRWNIEQGTGEPFGAAVFRSDTGQLVGVGMSQVVLHKNSVLHAEVVAIMMAEQHLQAFNLRVGGQRYELFSSCDPCAMCLGAVHWSEVSRLVCGASRDDAQQIGFDEGPVFPASYTYLEERGMEIVRGFCRAEAAAVIQAYSTNGGLIHNRAQE